ncbi:carboxylesterase family protein [Mycolicibacterium conceptionense]|nr:carboxylesterase family protein [Mycolicibacterium conceptionense]
MGGIVDGVFAMPGCDGVDELPVGENVTVPMEMDGEDPTKIQTNGLRYWNDTLAALGDGQSAGAVSIRLLMQMPPAQGLFRRVILQSGPGNDIGRSRESAEAIGQVFLGHLGEKPCTASASALLAAQQSTTTVQQQAGDASMPAFYSVLGTDVLPSASSGFGVKHRRYGCAVWMERR